ncbi:hypothetical protein [Segatella hominis]|uniref:Uncharacterized protein n=1 Tax=Segatella hominis TaxID=2518605 RepID=A0A4Y8VS21_9BACT|nr:hypothetical protein [Segatella hominis]TFH83384.1 hypothetical protein EXN75_03585 [Segatella hominis]
MHQVLQAVNFRFKVADDKGEMHEATEWYQVPLEIIDSIIQKIMNGTIIYFAYNKEQQCLEQRIEKKPSQLNLSGLKVLTLIIEKVYFEEIISGVKTEEYRSLKQTTLNKYTYIDEADASVISVVSMRLGFMWVIIRIGIVPWFWYWTPPMRMAW